MKTKKQIREYALGAAYAHFYSDEDTPWEPFENYDEEWLEEQCEELAQVIQVCMLWAQGENK
jgi:methionyl-tRNA synthetase